jgi:para-aminobenzoate synthetase / 4-amino-4-deoxychorismate lyase
VADREDAPDPALGVFDTLLVREGRPVDPGVHLERVVRSVEELYGVRVDVVALAERLRADVAGMTTARVRTSYDPVRSAWEIEATAIEEPTSEPRSLALRRLPDGLGPHKWIDRRLVAAPAANDVLLVDQDDHVLECGTANVFVVLGGVVVTPPLDGRILPGTVRRRVLSILADDGRRSAERVVGLAELASASEVFVTSSIAGVQPVETCAGVGSWPTGPVTGRLRRRRG